MQLQEMSYVDKIGKGKKTKKKIKKKPISRVRYARPEQKERLNPVNPNSIESLKEQINAFNEIVRLVYSNPGITSTKRKLLLLKVKEIGKQLVNAGNIDSQKVDNTNAIELDINNAAKHLETVFLSFDTMFKVEVQKEAAPIYNPLFHRSVFSNIIPLGLR